MVTIVKKIVDGLQEKYSLITQEELIKIINNMVNKHAVLLGSKGGNATLEKYGKEHFAEISKKGKETIEKRYGKDHYKKMAEKRWSNYRERKAKESEV